MDLNKLYFQHQIAVIQAANVNERRHRDCNRAKVDVLAREIEGIQAQLNARAANTWGGHWLPDGQWMPMSPAKSHDAA
ncbi:MAG: hypothetical protein KDE63_09810 [Novosphingobium sp.]|nr:hypothetical protein [Novosphingobium sp.]